MAQLGATFYPDGRIFTVAIIADQCDLNAHAQSGCVLVPLPIGAALSLYDPHLFRKACIPHIADTKLAATVQASCDAIDLAIATAAQQQNAAIASSLATWNALSPSVQAALIAADQSVVVSGL